MKRSRLAPVSARRQAQKARRAEVVAEVHERAGGRCEYADVVPEVECASYWWSSRPPLEVDELRGGAHRSSEWLDPEQCRLTCHAHHDWKTENKRELLKRLGLV